MALSCAPLLLFALGFVLADATHAEDWSTWQCAYDPCRGKNSHAAAGRVQTITSHL